MKAPADWYPDQHTPGQLRWWDGLQWTNQVTPMHHVPQPTAPPQQPSVRPPEPQPTLEAPKIPLFGARAMAREQAEEIDHLRAELARLGALDIATMTAERKRVTADLHNLRNRFAKEQGEQETKLSELRSRVVMTEEQEILQEVGLYSYRHPLADSVAYKDRLAELSKRIKHMATASGGG